jgi:hypothetical protein
MQEGENVLELVAESEGAARLIEARACEDTRRERPIEGPAVDQEVHRRLGGSDRDGGQQRVAVRCQLLRRFRDDGRLSPSARELCGVVGVAPRPEDEVRAHLLARTYAQVNLERRAGIQADTDVAAETDTAQCRRRPGVAFIPEEFGAVRRQTVRFPVGGQEGNLVAEVRVPVVACTQGSCRRVIVHDDARDAFFGDSSQQLARVVGGRDPSGAILVVAHV